MSRPKGYADWKPKDDTLDVLDAVNDVLREYSRFLPLTARQIFYRLVGAHGYAKTEKAYSNLCNYLVRARRAQMIPFDAIRDDGTTHNDFLKFTSAKNFWEQVADNASYYNRDKLENQPVYVELWCEAAGMVPQLERVASRYSIPVYSTGGFSSVTVTNEIADRALERDKPTVFLHAGDYDPSGESIFEAMTVDARQFLMQRLIWKLCSTPEGTRIYEDHWAENMLFPSDVLPDDLPDLRAVRVALTGDQVEEHGLDTAPPKSSDSRSVNWIGETAQLEAMPPDLLASTIDDAIQEVLYHDLLEEMWETEKKERAAIEAHVAEIIGANES